MKIRIYLVTIFIISGLIGCKNNQSREENGKAYVSDQGDQPIQNIPGISVYKERRPDHFWFGFVDDYVLIMIFKEPVFGMWMSASGGRSVRCPAWDYQFRSPAQKAKEKRCYHVRAVYKKFHGVEDVLNEVDAFLHEN